MSEFGVGGIGGGGGGAAARPQILAILDGVDELTKWWKDGG